MGAALPETRLSRPNEATILNMTGYYNLLGIPFGASAAQIRQAYRERAKAVHPDAHSGVSPEEKERLRQAFIQLAQAYEVLSDPVRRAAYDRKQRTRPGPGTSPSGEAPPPQDAKPEASAYSSMHATPTSGPDLEELLQDVEDLLGRFGMTRRQPLEAVLEALWNWAVAVYREVVLGEAEEAPARDRQAKAARSGASAGTEARSGDALHERMAAAEAVERELHRLKEHLRKKR